MRLALSGVLACGLGACGDGKPAAAADSATPTPTSQSTLESTGASGSGATAASTSATSLRRVVILGTSLTAGLGLDPDQAYPALLQRKADSAGFRISVVNAGLSGETSAGALRRAGWVLEQPAAAVVLEVGANDGLRGVDPDSTYANLVALIGMVRKRQPSATLLLVQMEAPTNLGRDYTSRFHAVYDKAAKAMGVTLLPFLLQGVAGDPRLNQADGIHPNVEGSKRVAATMWAALTPTFTGWQSEGVGAAAH